MADSFRLAEYFYITASNKPGEGARALKTLKEASVNLLAFSGFPQGRRAQLDFVPADPGAFKEAAKRARWKTAGPKRCFLVQGDDRVGAVAELLERLGAAKINVTAIDAVSAEEGRYASIFWVPPRTSRRQLPCWARHRRSLSIRLPGVARETKIKCFEPSLVYFLLYGAHIRTCIRDPALT